MIKSLYIFIFLISRGDIMKKILSLLFVTLLTLTLVSCAESLPASDYVAKGEIVIKNNVAFVTDGSVTIASESAVHDAHRLLSAHSKYSDFADIYGYKVLHQIEGYTSYCYTVYPLSNGELLYLMLTLDENGVPYINENTVIANENTTSLSVRAEDAPYILSSITDDQRTANFNNGWKQSDLIYSTYLRLSSKLELESFNAFFKNEDWDIIVRFIKLTENGNIAEVYELTAFLESQTSTVVKNTYKIDDNSTCAKSETTSVSLNSSDTAEVLNKIISMNYKTDYQSVSRADKIETGIFFDAFGSVDTNDFGGKISDFYSFYYPFAFTSDTENGELSNNIKMLDALLER